MPNIRTLESLYEYIEKEYAWRIIELSNYRSFVLQAKEKNLDALLRGSVTLLYAHWEGFIKKCADYYYSYVINLNYPLSELNNSFISIALRGEMESLTTSKKLKVHNDIIKVFYREKDKKPKFSSNSPIKTSNLNYGVFEDVCILLGLSIYDFDERYKAKGFDRNLEKFIDQTLVYKRNTIAHGNNLLITLTEFKELYDIVVNGLLYNFKELIMDCAQSKKFLNNG